MSARYAHHSRICSPRSPGAGRQPSSATSPASGSSSARRKPPKSSTRYGDRREAGRVVDDLRVAVALSHGQRVRAHLPPSTITRNEPSSGRLGSLSTRRMRSAAIVHRLGQRRPVGLHAAFAVADGASRPARRWRAGRRRAGRSTRAAGRTTSARGRRSRASRRASRPGRSRGEHGGLDVGRECGRLARRRVICRSSDA